ncbi:MAG: Ig-like domain-containing protein, partial [Bdellovibrionales bacterium]
MIFTYRLGLIVMVTTIVGVYMGCSSSPSGPVSSPGPAGAVTLEMGMTRIEQPGLDPFVVHVTASRNGNPLPGQNLILDVPKGSVSAVTDHGDGTYSFQVTPASTGTYPVTVQIGGSQADSLGLNSDVSLTRKAVVLDANVAGSGQPMAVPGTFVNTAGYEDGITITPDGEYLFVQYGPVYMSGPLYYTQICSSSAYSMGYDLNTCSTRPNSSFIFETVGPYNDQFRPSFPIGGISKEKLLHLSGLVIPGVVNGILAFPTVFYGFKRQADGTFAQPFKLAFDDSKGVNGPFGLSFKMNGDGTGTFVVAWDNYFNNLGDDGADVYTGTITFGRNNSMGQVTYNGDSFASITPTVSPVGF